MKPATISTPQTAPIDPVASPEAYRRELLSWLGEDDPAVVQQATVERLRAIVEAAGDHWVAGLRHRDDDPQDLIALFEALRNANLRLRAATSPADRERFGRHRERGPESYGLMVQLAAGHDRFHIAQAERALAAVRER